MSGKFAFLLVAALAASLGVAAPNRAAAGLSADLVLSDCTVSDLAQERADAKVLNEVETAAKGGGGFAVLRQHLSEMERALDHAPKTFNASELCNGHIVVRATELSDFLLVSAAFGKKEQLVKMLAGRPAPSEVEWLPSPYIQLSFYVGAVDNEDQHYDRALAALAKGLALDPTRPVLVNEAAQAYMFSHRPAEALALCDRALASQDRVLRDSEHALLLRTRGFALGDLDRFAEAEQSYRDSLKYDPGNRGALNEIRYYQQRQAGAKQTPVEMTTSDKFKTDGVSGAKPAAPQP